MKKIALIFYQGDWVAGGLWRYGYSLAREFLKIDPKNSYKIIHGRNNPENFLGLEKQEEIIPLRGWGKMLKLPMILQQNNFDVVHVTENACPFFWCGSYKKIVNIHDLMPLALPGAVNKKTFLYYKFFLPRALKKVDLIITSSQHSKNDIIRFYGINENKIKIIYHGVPDNYFKEINSEDLEKFKAKYQINEPYILSVSGINFRKNLKTVLLAYSQMDQKIKNTYKIYLVGKAEWEARETRDIIKKLGLENNVRILGEVPEGDLPYFYKLAKVFTFPSLYEGFGLPIVEAMAVGCPVISSNATCLPEITGGAAILVDPNDISGWKESMSQVLESNKLANDLIEKGKKRAQQFSWQNSARQHLELYFS